MKKLLVTLISALLIIMSVASCGHKGNSSSPGNLTPTAKPTPHISTGEEDVSGDYVKQLCSDYWLDTNTLHCCQLNENRTYIWLESKKDATQVSSGNWQLTKDDQDYLSLHMTDDATGETVTMHEIEFYDTSIYATDNDGNGIVWLTTERETESEA